jgi:hypothetical protein
LAPLHQEQRRAILMTDRIGGSVSPNTVSLRL